MKCTRISDKLGHPAAETFSLSSALNSTFLVQGERQSAIMYATNGKHHSIYFNEIYQRKMIIEDGGAFRGIDMHMCNIGSYS